MHTTYQHFVDAGAPDIKEPLFYRVKQLESGHVAVQLRRRAFLGSELVGQKIVRPSEQTPLLDDVVYAMTAVVEKHELREAHRSATDQLTGDFSAGDEDI